jgi:hypothetical protein
VLHGSMCAARVDVCSTSRCVLHESMCAARVDVCSTSRCVLHESMYAARVDVYWVLRRLRVRVGTAVRPGLADIIIIMIMITMIMMIMMIMMMMTIIIVLHYILYNRLHTITLATCYITPCHHIARWEPTLCITLRISRDPVVEWHRVPSHSVCPIPGTRAWHTNGTESRCLGMGQTPYDSMCAVLHD